jgi:2-methylcitrate dehydratase PrpD
MEQDLSTSAMTDTKTLCAHLAAARFGDLSPRAVSEARRGVLDWLGCALAGSPHPTLARLVAVLKEISGRPQASVFGRRLKLGLLDAALANGQMGHVLDFDDTHMSGVVLHASSPVLAALFALSEREAVSGADFALAYAVGFEAAVRAGLAAPGHYASGWHLTGTLGSIGAAAAAGKLLKLDKQLLTYAIGIGTCQAAGMQQNRGTSCKSFHAGKAAANGLLAALLAQNGFDSSQEIIEGRKGFCRIYSAVAAPEKLTADLGQSWEIERNGHKPYACGIVLHPLIDAVIALRERMKIDPRTVDEIVVRGHPTITSVTGVVEPATGLQSKFSVYHSAAVAFVDGAAGTAQYSNAKATDALIAALRRKVKPVVDESLRKDEAYASVTAGGARQEVHIPHASGTVDNPMTDAAIEAKFKANATDAIGAGNAQRVCDLVWALEKLGDMRELIRLIA